MVVNERYTYKYTVDDVFCFIKPGGKHIKSHDKGWFLIEEGSTDDSSSGQGRVHGRRQDDHVALEDGMARATRMGKTVIGKGGRFT